MDWEENPARRKFDVLTTHRHKTLAYTFVIVSKRGLELITLCDFEIMGAQIISHIIPPPVWVSQVDDLAGWLQDLYSVRIQHSLRLSCESEPQASLTT